MPITPEKRALIDKYHEHAAAYADNKAQYISVLHLIIAVGDTAKAYELTQDARKLAAAMAASEKEMDLLKYEIEDLSPRHNTFDLSSLLREFAAAVTFGVVTPRFSKRPQADPAPEPKPPEPTP